jgi:hypothetical protein
VEKLRAARCLWYETAIGCCGADVDVVEERREVLQLGSAWLARAAREPTPTVADAHTA